MRYQPFRHLGLKLLSLGIAVLLWLTLSGEQTVERGLRIPLEIQNLPAGLQLVDEPPELIDVRVRGASGGLRRLGQGDLVAVIDARSARPGRRLFHLTTDLVRAPFGVEVTHVNPPSVGMSFERAAEREVPIVPAIDGEPAPGYVVGKVSSEPPTVVVVGPQSMLVRATGAITEPVSVAGATDDRLEIVTVGVLDSTLRLKTPGTAKVLVRILPAPTERVVANVPVHLRGLAAGLSARVVPSVVSIRTRGQRSELDALRPDSLNAYVDVSGLTPGRYDLSVRVDPTELFGVTDIVPAAVTMRIR